MKIAFYDTKPYDREWFDQLEHERYGFKYIEAKLNSDTAQLASGCKGVVAFVNDTLDKETIDVLYGLGVEVIAMRCAGYNNVDMQAAYEKIHVLRVPSYSPYSVAEHAAALLLCLNRKIHKAYNRTRDFNFTLSNLTGFDLHGKTVGVIGTGQIGKIFINICKGFGMEVLAYDPYPDTKADIHYVDLKELLNQSDIISLHCPLTDMTHHIINSDSIKEMKDGVFLINTSRGALVESEALLEALKSKKIGAAGLDVYEEEAEVFFEDYSNEIIKDDTLHLLVSMPNVVLTSHQAFLTKEALRNIAETTIQNLNDYFDGSPLKNEICYLVHSNTVQTNCSHKKNGRCF
ncbi:MAG TPA: 2-hydroxyacid dehydrogenase [Lachnospiraceae bacterium]|nr:2-hydroxyacid dehydrogenase [Lachnospiraceae bacterium]